MHHYLILLATSLRDWEYHLWNSQARMYFCIWSSKACTVYTTWWMISSAFCTWIYQAMFICNCYLISDNISQSQIFRQWIYRMRWQHIDPFCSTLFFCRYSCFLSWHWLLSRPVQLFTFTPSLAESIREHVVQYKHAAGMHIPDPPCSGHALHQIDHLPYCCFCTYVLYPMNLGC